MDREKIHRWTVRETERYTKRGGETMRHEMCVDSYAYIEKI